MFQPWTLRKVYDYVAQVEDYEDIADLGQAITSARVALFRITEKINQYERAEQEAKVKYDRTFRRRYIASTEKTEAAKKIRAELYCEDLENDYLAAKQLKDELILASNTLRLELQTLQAIGNNIRQQLKMAYNGPV